MSCSRVTALVAICALVAGACTGASGASGASGTSSASGTTPPSPRPSVRASGEPTGAATRRLEREVCAQNSHEVLLRTWRGVMLGRVRGRRNQTIRLASSPTRISPTPIMTPDVLRSLCLLCAIATMASVITPNAMSSRPRSPIGRFRLP